MIRKHKLEITIELYEDGEFVLGGLDRLTKPGVIIEGDTQGENVTASGTLIGGADFEEAKCFLNEKAVKILSSYAL